MKNKNIFFQTSVAHIFTFAKAEWQATMKMYYFSFLLRFFFQSWEFCCFPSTFSPHGNSVAQTRPASGRNTKFHLNWSCVKRWAGQPTDVRIPRAAPLVLARNRSHVITPIFFFSFLPLVKQNSPLLFYNHSSAIRHHQGTSWWMSMATISFFLSSPAVSWYFFCWFIPYCYLEMDGWGERIKS